MPFLTAHATISFAKVSDYYDTIIESFSAHNMQLRPDGDGQAITSPLGAARLSRKPGVLELWVEASDPAAFNRLKHELTGLVHFVTRPEALEIIWIGDKIGAMLPADLRVLTVRRVTDVTPHMRRISFDGQNLAHYAAPDQIHCRLLFQGKGISEPQWPHLDDNGRILWPDTGKLASRIFTIRRIDAAAGTLDIDFILHNGAGPGASWAAAAAPGDCVGILGPAAYGPKAARWSVLVGDETGLPGIARILEDMPESAQGVALIEVADATEEQPLHRPHGVKVVWRHRNAVPAGTSSLLLDALRAIEFPPERDDVFAWVGAEYSAFRSIRGYLRREIGLSAAQMIAFSHWRRGMSEDDIVDVGISSVSA